jgi:phosphoribosylanthranilate isomerase
MKLKVCGMKYPENIIEMAALQPDYMGFIFWEPSPRYFNGSIPILAEPTQKVGVFVNAAIDEIEDKVKQHNLHAIQLHGEESPAYCRHLKRLNVEVIKVFSIGKHFDFTLLEPYEAVSDYYLFDTKGKLPGGNGYGFDWKVLENYPYVKPYFLSGGIGLEEVNSLTSFLKTPAAKYCYAVDVNSKFEIQPGLKNLLKLKEFIGSLKVISK